MIFYWLLCYKRNLFCICTYLHMNSNNHFRSDSSRLTRALRLGLFAVGAWFFAAEALSNPVNPVVVNGAATFNQAGNVLTVNNSPGIIINWNKFSIQIGETTHFAQASASSTVLNRVLNDPTAIYGTLSSNGRVWLVNPAGIMVGPGGKVDVAAFVASTLNISNADFLAGRSVFINDGSAGNVINQGEIRTPAGGSVYLIGSNVTNEGIIFTPKGETILAAGATVSLIDSATPGVKVDITGSEGNATNLGRITAEAGRIGIAGVIVRNSGTLNASSVVSEGGRVFLKASQDAYVDGNGRIVTTGTPNGSIEILADRIDLADGASIDASGTHGGGTILIDGDLQSQNPYIPNGTIIPGSINQAGGVLKVTTVAHSDATIINFEFHVARLQILNYGTFQNVFNRNAITTSVGGGVYLTANQRNATAPGSPSAPRATVSLIDSSTPGVKVDISGADGGTIDVGSITAAAVRNGIAGVLVRTGGTLGAR